ncbi:MAG: transketolase C-terminal domain-containing protein [Verrucomicrobiota bacterium]|jgi:transketolase
MRTAFINELIHQARNHPEIFLVTGDLGFSVVEPFAQEFPDRYLNAGVAEQNMTGVAAGLASEGYHVFTYSIANFPTLRCLEQIRNDVAYHHLPVTVVSVGAGFSYGNLGYSHHAVQDIGILRTLPEMTILSPADPGETRECMQWLAENPCPSYLRLGKAGEPVLHEARGLTRGPLKVLEGRSNCALVATGSILKVALDAARKLGDEGISVSVYSCPWLQPVTAEWFQPLARFQRLLVLEEHVPSGGLASLLREHLPESVRVISPSLPAAVLGEVGSQVYLRQKACLNTDEVWRQLLAELS